MDWHIFYPWLKVAPQKFCANISTLFFFGALKAPGTWGSAVGALFVAFVMMRVSPIFYIALMLFLIYLAIGICDIGEGFFNLKDPGKINLDEFVAMPVCYLPIYFGSVCGNHFWWWILCGFLLFRFFDILKPLGIKNIQVLSGGLGCVADDILAAVYTAIVLFTINVVY